MFFDLFIYLFLLYVLFTWKDNLGLINSWLFTFYKKLEIIRSIIPLLSHYNGWNFTCCHLVTNLCSTICHLMNCSTPGFPVPHHLLEFAEVDVLSISDTIQPSLPRCPLLLLPSVFLGIRVFSNESALRIRWPKYWSISFSISTSNEYSGLISFRIDWFDLLDVQGCSGVFSSTTVWKHSTLLMV